MSRRRVLRIGPRVTSSPYPFGRSAATVRGVAPARRCRRNRPPIHRVVTCQRLRSSASAIGTSRTEPNWRQRIVMHRFQREKPHGERMNSPPEVRRIRSDSASTIARQADHRRCFVQPPVAAREDPSAGPGRERVISVPSPVPTLGAVDHHAAGVLDAVPGERVPAHSSRTRRPSLPARRPRVAARDLGEGERTVPAMDSPSTWSRTRCAGRRPRPRLRSISQRYAHPACAPARGAPRARLDPVRSSSRCMPPAHRRDGAVAVVVGCRSFRPS